MQFFDLLANCNFITNHKLTLFRQVFGDIFMATIEIFIEFQEAGLPIGGIDFNPFVMLEVHYNNPTLRGGK